MIVENNRVVSLNNLLKDDAGNFFHDNTKLEAEE
jgi:hypothetical protein